VIETLHAAVGGRIRLKVLGLYRSPALKRHIEDKLILHPEVHACTADPLTGHVLIHYPSSTDASRIIFLVQETVLALNPSDHRTKSEGRHPAIYEKFFADRYTDPGKGPGPFAHARSKSHTLPGKRKTRRMVLRGTVQKAACWHIRSVASLLEKFQSHPEQGLSEKEAAKRLRRYGPNLLPEAVPRSALAIFFRQFQSLPVILLGIASLVSFFTGGWLDALVIISAILLNALIGFFTENQAEKTFFSLKTLIRPSALVRREGRTLLIGAELVVPGDLLILQPGGYISADARLIAVDRLTIDESLLTGESLPVLKTVEPLEEEDQPLADRTNMVHMGTLVTGGQGLALALATGRYTEIGRIQTLVGQAARPQSPMERELNRLGGRLTLISLGVCGLVFLVGILRGFGLLEMFGSSVALAVAAVPEGLPMVATTTLALGVRRMRRHNVLIRNLAAVETLGSVQTLCLDKTGTLTRNHMRVSTLFAGLTSYRITDAFIVEDGKGKIDPLGLPELLQLLHVGVLCNESVLVPIEAENGHERELKGGPINGRTSINLDGYSISGSATENALIHLALMAGVNILDLRKRHPVRKIIYRSEKQNYMISLHDVGRANEFLVAAKGNPLEVLELCRWQVRNGKTIPLTDQDRQAVEKENERLAGMAMRVLGFAYLPVSKRITFGKDGELKNRLIWLGLAGMVDPLRPGVRELIDTFHRAGLDTVMITGDQPTTAYAVGKALRLHPEDELQILDSTHLNQMNFEVLSALADRIRIYARVSPSHKLQIVQAYQKKGRVVAMTGDGINDGPALKAADIGIAMGHTGTDVAREVADVILEDDQLETLVVAIAQGRTIYNNIKKSIHFLLSTNFSEIWTVLIGTLIGRGHPLNTRQLLYINLISDILPGLALALEPPEPDVLTRPPREPEEAVLDAKDFEDIIFESGVLAAPPLTLYGYGLIRYGPGAKANTLAFMGLSTAQLLHTFSCRGKVPVIFSSRSIPNHPFLTFSVFGSLILQGAIILFPAFRNFLGLTTLTAGETLCVGGAGLLSLMVNESRKSAGGGR
jgi:Ca2+-transporting ATPase